MHFKKNPQPSFGDKLRLTPQKNILIIVAIIMGAIVFGGGSTYVWYQHNLQAMQTQSSKRQMKRFVIKSGETPEIIATHLEEQGLVRSNGVFLWYTKQQKVQHKLQAGTYALHDAMSVQEITKHLVEGKTDSFLLTIVPGRTLKELRADLQKYGYTNDEINEAFSAKYSSLLLRSKPASATLEGYLYPETFQVQSSESLVSVFERDFALFYEKIQTDGLEEVFKRQGLSLHQALTLASIVQQESSNPQEQKQISQVFHKRLSIDMKLESDPTFVYPARQQGVEPRVTIDSPYNTRLHKGLPPGPIGTMNYSALQAVAYPASGDYLYFVAGDNGTTYFSHTIEEHEAKAAEYCKKLCQMF